MGTPPEVVGTRAAAGQQRGEQRQGERPRATARVMASPPRPPAGRRHGAAAASAAARRCRPASAWRRLCSMAGCRSKTRPASASGRAPKRCRIAGASRASSVPAACSSASATGSSSAGGRGHGQRQPAHLAARRTGAAVDPVPRLRPVGAADVLEDAPRQRRALPGAGLPRLRRARCARSARRAIQWPPPASSITAPRPPARCMRPCASMKAAIDPVPAYSTTPAPGAKAARQTSSMSVMACTAAAADAERGGGQPAQQRRLRRLEAGDAGDDTRRPRPAARSPPRCRAAPRRRPRGRRRCRVAGRRSTPRGPRRAGAPSAPASAQRVCVPPASSPSPSARRGGGGGRRASLMAGILRARAAGSQFVRCPDPGGRPWSPASLPSPRAGGRAATACRPRCSRHCTRPACRPTHWRPWPCRWRAGRWPWRYRADVPMQPGSAMKLVTSIVALDRLGPNHRGHTELRSAAPVRGRRAARRPRAQGRRRPRTGRAAVVGAAAGPAPGGRAHDRRPAGASTARCSARRGMDLGLPPFDEAPEFPYNVIPDALQLAGSLLPLELRADADGVHASTVPPLDGIEFTSRMALTDTPLRRLGRRLAAGARDAGEAGRTRIELQGGFPQGLHAARRAAADRPPGADRGAVPHALARPGRPLVGRRRGGRQRPPARACWRGARAGPGASCCAHEQELGQRRARGCCTCRWAWPAWPPSRRPRTAALAEREVRRWLAAHGIDDAGLVLDNGSGLSRSERITPLQLASMLKVAWRGRQPPELLMSLPVAGVDGTLRNRLQRQPGHRLGAAEDRHAAQRGGAGRLCQRRPRAGPGRWR